ncbi:uncharacterized protein ACA1_243620 [Acanthamoeba castellanii str. Neff]|uniref:Uncharacterized protein n=1 Tax=Acanthamoeba castellanii (strain ATCC 30010 / Neff) TaxID=1257118 RepID=L8GK39_ACACF|nr:uncharacterized protein ACA1_243620 [Acanthamoeba castellanii str. Neff]ELR13402.1 hypothetical protein ACA1_243620 [Acanthamoeba castellanii str. Neff]
MERRTRCHLALLPYLLLVVLASLVAASEVTPSPVAPAGFDHTLWTRVLQSYASTAKIDGIQETVVDYETLRRRADPDFANYLDKLADFDPATLSGSREETLAFWLLETLHEELAHVTANVLELFCHRDYQGFASFFHDALLLIQDLGAVWKLYEKGHQKKQEAVYIVAFSNFLAAYPETGLTTNADGDKTGFLLTITDPVDVASC